MCGIAGCYQQTDGETLVRLMNDRIAHRGPDADGLYSFTSDSMSVQLAHRRLSIIDLSAAADQPLSKDGLTISYNGELYNYKEIRAELAASGVRFTTTSDTEVILEAWRCYGPNALRRFRGMFAFALFDEATGKLVLARDPLGIKPLYWMQRQDGIVFASELKALVAAVGKELEVDHGTLVASMLYYWVPDQRCSLLRCEEAAPRVLDGDLAPADMQSRRGTSRYPISPERLRTKNPSDLRAVIEESVKAHLVADVPVSSFLSGGLDSSIVTVLAKRANPDMDCLHDPIPRSGPASRGHARRCPVRAQGRPAIRHPAARDRDRARHRRSPATDGRRSRRADR